MRRSSALLAIASALVVAVGANASAVSSLGASPTQLVKQAKALGITKAGSKYRFHQEERIGDETLRLTVDIPTAWSDTADSHFINPDTNEPYGAGLRATTDADKFRESFDVPGVKVNAAGFTREEIASFDPAELVANNAYTGCRDGRVRPFDNGTWKGMYQTFDRCDRTRAAAVVVAADDGTTELLVSAQVLTKADLAAIDRVLSSATVERTSI